MTREELFRAVGEVREDQIQAAETVKKQVRPWRRAGALAACLVLVAAIGAAAVELEEADRWKSIVWSFNPGVEVDEDPDSWKAIVRPFQPEEADSGGGTAAGGLDGSEYWTDDPARPTRPDWSTGVEIGQLSGPGSSAGMMSMSSCAAWLSPEEIFAQDTVIFRGTVRELHYFQIEMDGWYMPLYFTRALVEVTDPIRGNLETGKRYSLLWLGAKGYLSTSLSGPLEDLDAGSEAIFMPAWTGRDTGWTEGESYFCYADLAELYLSEGQRYVFADTAEGLTFDRGVYEEIADAETLDEAAAYIRRMVEAEQTAVIPIPQEPREEESGKYVFVEGSEQTQNAEGPVLPQTEPSETAEAGPTRGPDGARELPGGAYAGEPGQ